MPIQQDWATLRLCSTNILQPNHQLTFLEEVGTATSENVRSAALCRWIRSAPAQAAKWLSAVIGQSVPNVTDARREVYLSPGNRADLVVSLANGQQIIIEVKWSSLPDTDQLQRYVGANVGGNVFPVVLLCPHYWSAPLGGVVSAQWTSLLPFLPALKRNGQMHLSTDLRITIERLRVVEDAIMLSTQPTAPAAQIAAPVQELRNMQAQLGEGTVRTLLGQLELIASKMLLCRLAAQHVAAGYGPEVRVAAGANGTDLTVDVPFCPQQNNPTWYELVHNAAPGSPATLACVVRFRYAPGTGMTSICLGTHPMPYLDGTAKQAWVTGNLQDEITRAYNLSARRRDLYTAARVQANANVGDWWSAVATNNFGHNFATVQDGLNYAGNLAGTIVP